MELLDKLLGISNSKKNEDEFTITITEEMVKVEHPKRSTQQIKWKDINEIKLVNTTGGPFAPDLWLILIGLNGGCRIPRSAKEFDRLFDIVSQYKGFRHDNLEEALSNTDNGQLHLWLRE